MSSWISVDGFLAQIRGLACDACPAQPFDAGYSSTERINKLASRMCHEIFICHRRAFFHARGLRRAPT